MLGQTHTYAGVSPIVMEVFASNVQVWFNKKLERMINLDDRKGRGVSLCFQSVLARPAR